MPDSVRQVSHSTFVRKEEHARSWKYEDPFVGVLWVYKTDLSDPPPMHLRVTIDAIEPGRRSKE